MLQQNKFSELFLRLTETSPFPWQQSLYDSFTRGQIPSGANLPTGLGKTSVVAIWLIALITHPDRMPRRLVYVVNRRTVVDQTTAEVERLRERLHKSSDLLAELKKRCAVSFDSPLALSTLRGQFADNREWCADPTRAAVIVGTVDMVGSGLLFSRYTCGFKTRPHHAALLGQDALLVHDEAHLEPAFQKLLASIVAEQERCKDARPLRVLELSATTRETSSSFGLTPEDEKDPRVTARLCAPKRLVLHPIGDEKQLADKLTALALARRDSGRAVLVFARLVEVVQRVNEELEKQKLATVVLTGTMRGKERDELARQNRRFLRFLPESSRPAASPASTEGTVYLIATSAAEVGINISASDLVCDLSTYESLAQRFGRVNRFGETPDSTIDLVHPTSFDQREPCESARARTLELLRQLAGDASPNALRKLDPTVRIAAFSPLPEMRPATDILFDAWALTSIRDVLPGRPQVAAYLHGEQPEWEQPETHVAWRREVDEITGALLDYYPPRELIEDYPLKPHELLRDRSFRVREQLAQIAKRFAKSSSEGDEPRVWLVDDDDRVELKPISFFTDKDSESRLHGRTILLPPSLGGLSPSGLLDGKAESSGSGSEDVADKTPIPIRKRIFNSIPEISDRHEYSQWRLVRVIDLQRSKEESEDDEAFDENRYWLWLEAPAASDAGGIRKAGKSVLLEDHTRDVERHATAIGQKLNLPETVFRCVVLAARFHDLGKSRRYWQRGIGNDDAKLCLAKAGRELRSRTLDEPYRHEFGSLRDAQLEAEFQKLGPDDSDLVLHLVAAHHGRARPHFPIEEAFDPDGTPVDSEAIAIEIPRRFARLQHQFGRWGLAYLESLLRAADYAASAGVSPNTQPAP